jgi:hypothetical protein
MLIKNGEPPKVTKKSAGVLEASRHPRNFDLP